MSTYLIDKAKLIIEEINQRRSEILEMQRMLLKVGIFFITVIGASVGTLINNSIVNNNGAFFKQTVEIMSYKIKVGNVIMFAIAQLEFFLAIVAVLIICLIIVNASYIRAQESKVNKLLGERVWMWETEISAKHINCFNAPFLWSGLIIGVFLYFFFLILMMNVTSDKDLQQTEWLIPLVWIEFVTPLFILAYQFFIKMKEVEKHATSKYDEPVP